jgi:hypothetical protein
MNEQVQLSVTASGTDQDLPAQTMSYSLVTAPAGMTINSATGQITWTPTEAQGPGEFDVTVRVTDDGSPALAHTTSFKVTVSEVNLPPEVAEVSGAIGHAGAAFTTTLGAADPDVPANAFTYSLVSGPAGATVSTAGKVAWTPSLAAAGSVADFTVRVTDDGSPAASGDRTFQVTVIGPVDILTVVRIGEELELTWRAVAGLSYRLIQADALPATLWSPVPGTVQATGATATKSVPLGAQPGGGFFRVEFLGE